MCWTSAYYVRCLTCGDDLDRRLEVDTMCRNKRKGLTPCTYIYPVKVNVQWVDMTNCLPCTAKRDILETMKQKTIDQDEKEKKERGEEEEESDDALIRKQLIDDENHQMEAEKRDRIEEWLQGLFESRRTVGPQR